MLGDFQLWCEIASEARREKDASVAPRSRRVVAVRRREARAAAEESAAAGLVDEEITAVKALTVIPKAIEEPAFPLRGNFVPNWADFFDMDGVAHLRIHVGEGGARLGDLEGVGRALVPFVGGNGVGGGEVDFCQSGGGFLPGNSGVAGASGASVYLVMTRVTVDMDPDVGDATREVAQDWRAIVPWRQGDEQGGRKRDIVLGEGVCLPGRAGVAGAPGAGAGSVVVPFTAQLCRLVGDGTWDLERVGPTMVLWVADDGVRGGGREQGVGGGVRLPGGAGVAGASSGVSVVSSTLETCPAVGDGTWDLERVGPTMVLWVADDGVRGGGREQGVGGGVCLPGSAGVAGASSGVSVVSSTLETCPAVGDGTWDLERVGPTMVLWVADDGVRGGMRMQGEGGGVCLPGGAGVAGASSGVSVVSSTLETCPAVGDGTWDLERVGPTMVLWVADDGVRGGGREQGIGGGVCLPGSAGVAGASSGVSVVSSTLETCPAVGDGTWDLERVGPTMVLWVADDGVRGGGREQGVGGGVCLPGSAGVAGASSGVSVVSSTLETCPAVGDGTWDLERVGPTMVLWVADDGVRGGGREQGVGGGVCLPGSAGVAGASSGVSVVSSTLETCPAVGDGTWDLERVGPTMVLWVADDGVRGGGREQGVGGGVCLPGSAGVAGASSGVSVVSFTLETCPAVANSTSNEEQVGTSLVPTGRDDEEWGEDKHLETGGAGYLPGKAGVAGAPTVPYTLEAGRAVGNGTWDADEVGLKAEGIIAGDVQRCFKDTSFAQNAILLCSRAPARRWLPGLAGQIAPQQQAVAASPMVGVAPIVEPGVHAAATSVAAVKPDICPAVDTWLCLAHMPQREAVAVPSMVGVAPIVEPRANAVADPIAAPKAVNVAKAGALVEAGFSRHPPHGHGELDCVSVTAGGVIGLCALYLARLFHRRGGRRRKKKRGRFRRVTAINSGEVQETPRTDAAVQMVVAFVDYVRRAGGGHGWDEGTTPPPVQVLLGGHATKSEVSGPRARFDALGTPMPVMTGANHHAQRRDMKNVRPAVDRVMALGETIQGVIVLLTSILSSPGGKEDLLKVLECASLEVHGLGTRVADTGVAMGLLPSTMAGGTEGLASPSTVAMTWAPSSLWLSAQDMGAYATADMELLPPTVAGGAGDPSSLTLVALTDSPSSSAPAMEAEAAPVTPPPSQEATKKPPGAPTGASPSVGDVPFGVSPSGSSLQGVTALGAAVESTDRLASDRTIGKTGPAGTGEVLKDEEAANVLALRQRRTDAQKERAAARGAGTAECNREAGRVDDVDAFDIAAPVLPPSP
eukprot:jgi/Undpi1/2066/HiC_scaffold_12.g05452.m1